MAGAVYNPLDWQARLIDARVGQPLEVLVNDGGRERVAARESAAMRLRWRPNACRALSDQFELITVTPAIRSERRMASPRGALIRASPSRTRRAGLRQGDVIVRVNQCPCARRKKPRSS